MEAITHDLQWLNDPEVFAVNRLPAHSDHLFYEKQKNDLKQCLNGYWKFNYAGNPGLRVLDFYQKDYPAESWDSIEVPGHIQLQGYDRCHYTNTLYPWDGEEHLRPPQVSARYNPVGQYVTDFTVNPTYQGNDIILHFDGVETAFYVWVNGEFVGYSEDSFTPAEFDITNLLCDGKNRLAVEVYKRSSASWLEDQDFWRFSGIFRDVYLYALPKVHINDLFIKTILSDDFLNAQIVAQLSFSQKTSATLKTSLYHPDGMEIASDVTSVSESNLQVVFDIKNPLLWSAEAPSLYKLVFTLENSDGKILEIVPQKVGIRRFEMKNGVMHLNGQRIIFKGVNRHEFNPRRGRAVTKEDMLWDIRFMKRNNLNAVRTSHYPNQSLWYSLCDEYGIYLIDETNLESHGSWQKLSVVEPSWNVPSDDPKWQEAVFDRGRSMLERDKNHPSVLIWSCGNECFGGRVLYNLSEYFRKTDPSRLVHYEGVFHDRRYNGTSDMESRMYAKPADIAKYLDGHPDKPYISCEYLHTMGNSGGGLHYYTELEDRYEQYQGGFIWDYIDQFLYRKTESGEEVLAYGGDFGDRTSDYNFCGNGIVYADRRESPKVQEVKYLYQNVKLIPDSKGVNIKNQNLFISTAGYYFAYTLKTETSCLASGSFEADIPAGTEEYIALSLPTINPAQDEYVLSVTMHLKENTLWANKGYEIAFGQTVFGTKAALSLTPNNPLKIIHGDGNIGVRGKDFYVLFSKQSDGIVSLKYDGEEYVSVPPKPTYWRALTDNDKGTNLGFSAAYWFSASAFQTCVGVVSSEADHKITVTYRYRLSASDEHIVTTSYTVDGTGNISVDVSFPGGEDLPEVPLFGWEIKLPAAYNKVKYYGLGPEENYSDRNCGARLGHFETTAAENFSAYAVPQESGSRTGVRSASVISPANPKRGLTFTAEHCPFTLRALPYSALMMESAYHREELPAPDGTYVTVCRQMGVGGDDSWGAPVHDEHRIPANQPLELHFKISRVIE